MCAALIGELQPRMLHELIRGHECDNACVARLERREHLAEQCVDRGLRLFLRQELAHELRDERAVGHRRKILAELLRMMEQRGRPHRIKPLSLRELRLDLVEHLQSRCKRTFRAARAESRGPDEAAFPCEERDDLIRIAPVVHAENQCRCRVARHQRCSPFVPVRASDANAAPSSCSGAVCLLLSFSSCAP